MFQGYQRVTKWKQTLGVEYAHTVEAELEQKAQLLQQNVRLSVLICSGQQWDFDCYECDLTKTSPNAKCSHKNCTDLKVHWAQGPFCNWEVSRTERRRSVQTCTFPITLSQLLLARGSQCSLQSLRVFYSINVLICFSFIVSEIKCTKWFLIIVFKKSGIKFWLYSRQSLWHLHFKILQFRWELQNLPHTTD